MNKICIIGDSITHSNPRTDVINLGVPGDMTIDLINRLDDILEKSSNKECYLMVGVNDMFREPKKESTIKNYEVLVREISIVSKSLTLLSILPITEIKGVEGIIEKNETLKYFNNEIKKLAKKYSLRYLDLRKEFEDVNGLLEKNYSTDGLHLNSCGYKVLNEKIKDKRKIISLIGDSITEFNSREDAINLGIAGNTTKNLIERLDEILSKVKGTDSYLMIGVNDLFMDIPYKSTILNYKKLVENISKEVNSLKVLSVLPLVDNDEKNEIIKTLNDEIKEISIAYNLQFLNVRERLEDINGNLISDYSTDGTHLNTLGYKVLNEAF